MHVDVDTSSVYLWNTNKLHLQKYLEFSYLRWPIQGNAKILEFWKVIILIKNNGLKKILLELKVIDSKIQITEVL